jgi:phytoene synthase
MNVADQHCLDLVRRHDRDRFIASLYAPDDLRPHLLALYAFDFEVARIADLVSEPAIGLIRQRWWHDTIEACAAGNAPDHPVAQGLARAMAAKGLPAAPLHALIGAREFDLYADPMADLGQLEGYLGETAAAVIQLAALVLSPSTAPALAEAAGLSGVALGLTRLLSRPGLRQHYLPAGMSVDAAIAHARQRLAEARRAASAMPVAVLPAFLPLCLVPLDLARLARQPDRPPDVTHFRRQLTLHWHAWRENF